MGYVPPQPQPTASSGPVSETVLKNPAIQTVYRFLKSNGDRKQDFSELLAHNPSLQFNNSSRTSSLVSPTEFLDDQTTHAEVSVLPAVTLPQSTLNPKPPPLPPRTISAARQEGPSPPSGSNSLNTTVEENVCAQMNNSKSTVGFTTQEPVPDDTPAHVDCGPSIDQSEPLRMDLEQTGTTSKASVAGVGTPPPLPPRRMPVLPSSQRSMIPFLGIILIS
jgi:hypothetical protein